MSSSSSRKSHKSHSHNPKSEGERRDQRWIAHVSEKFVSPYFSAMDSPNRLKVSINKLQLHLPAFICQLVLKAVKREIFLFQLESSSPTLPSISTLSLSTPIQFRSFRHFIFPIQLYLGTEIHFKGVRSIKCWKLYLNQNMKFRYLIVRYWEEIIKA